MKYLKPIGFIVVIAVLVSAVVSCGTSNSDSDLDLIPINSVTSEGYTISLEAEKELETGANYLYWKIQQGEDLVDVQSFTINPMMDMETMMHSTPHTQPELAPEDDHYLKNRAIFIMPSGSMGSWTINFELLTQNDEIIAGEMPVEIGSSWKLNSVRKDDKVYFITWYAPQKPVSGNNDLIFMVHTRESMMSFPPVTDAEMEVYPYMDMGSGSGHSTDFSNPVATGDGFYKGDINYSMSGTWTTSVELIVDNDTLPEVVFEYNVQAK